MKKILLFALSLTTHSLFSQPSVTDSLKKEIDSRETVDTTLINLRANYINELFIITAGDSSFLRYATETLELAQSINYPKGIIMSKQSIGIIYQYFLAKPLVALEYYHEAIELIDQNPVLEVYLISSLTNIATIYMEKQEYEKAMGIYRKLYNEYNQYQVNEQYLGVLFGQMDQLDSSIYYFEKAIERAVAEKNLYVEGVCTSNLSLVYARANQLDKAIKASERALYLANTHQVVLMKLPAYLNASEVYLIAQDYDLAEYYALEALKTPGLEAHLYYKKSLYATLYDAYAAQEKYKSALEAHEQFKFFSDSLTSIDQRVRFLEKDLTFEAERKELLAEAEISKQLLINRIYLISGLGILLLGVLTIFLAWKRKKSLVKAKEAEFRRGLAESKLVTLRTQLNPHFLFNALNSIDDYMFKEGVEKASTYLVKFSSLMREILENSEKDWITLADEMKLMQQYVDIEKLRLHHPLHLKIHIDTQLDAENTLVPSLFIQPFIENSINHGILKKEGPGKISVQVKKETGDRITCVIEDDGVGRTVKTTNIKNASMGNKIAESRIDYIGQLTGNVTSFDIQDLAPGVKVTLSIPYQTRF